MFCWRWPWPGDILLAVILAKVLQKNNETQQKIDTADDFVRAMTPVLQSETDLLAEQLRAMQGGERPHHQRHTAGFLRRAGREPAPECGHQYRTAGGYRPRRGCPPEGCQRRPAGPADNDGNAVEKPGRFQRRADGQRARRGGAGLEHHPRPTTTKSWTKFAVPSKKSCRTPCSSASTIRSRRSAPS